MVSRIPKGKIKDKERGLVPDSTFGCKDKEYNAFLDTLDPKQNFAIRQELAAATDNRFVEFLRRIEHSVNRKYSLATNAIACGISLKEFNDWAYKAVSQRNIAQATLRSAKHVEDIDRIALSREEGCPRCEALGWIIAEEGMPDDTVGYQILRTIEAEGKTVTVWRRTCPKCLGAKTLLVPGHDKAREQLFEMAGLTGKKGVGVQIIQNLGGMGIASAVGRLNEAVSIDVDFE